MGWAKARLQSKSLQSNNLKNSRLTGGSRNAEIHIWQFWQNLYLQNSALRGVSLENSWVGCYCWVLHNCCLALRNNTQVFFCEGWFVLGLRREGRREREREGEKESSVCIFYSFLIRSCFFPAQVLFSSLSLSLTVSPLMAYFLLVLLLLAECCFNLVCVFVYFFAKNFGARKKGLVVDEELDSDEKWRIDCTQTQICRGSIL